jgi:hypothetical protein
MNMQLKIDVDGSFREWFDFFKKQYPYFSIRVKFNDSAVFRTMHGLHIYLYTLAKMGRDKNLLECLLGSDIRKQNYYFVEGDDVLFKDRELYVSKYSSQLKRFISKVKQQHLRLVIYEQTTNPHKKQNTTARWLRNRKSTLSD